jgi:hypothetical protein
MGKKKTHLPKARENPEVPSGIRGCPAGAWWRSQEPTGKTPKSLTESIYTKLCSPLKGIAIFTRMVANYPNAYFNDVGESRM